MNAESGLKEILFFFEMDGFQSGGHTSTRVTAGVKDMTTVVMGGLVEESLNAWLGETPSTRIKGLLLTPDNILSVRITIEVLLELQPWEWVQLLNTSNSGVLDAVTGSVLLQSGINLSGADNNTFNVFFVAVDGRSMFGVGDYPLEVRVTSEVLNRRSAQGVS